MLTYKHSTSGGRKSRGNSFKELVLERVSRPQGTVITLETSLASRFHGFALAGMALSHAWVHLVIASAAETGSSPETTSSNSPAR